MIKEIKFTDNAINQINHLLSSKEKGSFFRIAIKGGGCSGFQYDFSYDKSQNDDMVLTYHDSCNVARASRMGDKAGGQFEIPRNIIKSVCNNFYDMPKDTIKEGTYCCGGGGGLLTDDLMELRVKGALPRMEALRQVVEDNGVTHMAAICAICKSQFAKVFPYYDFTMDQIVSVHQLVSNAIILTGQHDENDENDGENHPQQDIDEAA